MLALLSCHQLFALHVTTQQLTTHLIFNALSLWEPFLCMDGYYYALTEHSGLFQRFYSPQFVFLAYHIGSYPINQMSVLSIAAILIGVLFRSTKNLLIIYPFFWAASSSVGTLQGQVTLTQHDCLRYLLLCSLQICSLLWMYRKMKKNQNL